MKPWAGIIRNGVQKRDPAPGDCGNRTAQIFIVHGRSQHRQAPENFLNRLGREAEADHVMTRRARQNVWLEFGWDCLELLWLQSGEMEIPSDIQSLMSSRYRENPAEESEDIRKFLNSLGAVPLRVSQSA